MYNEPFVINKEKEEFLKVEIVKATANHINALIELMYKRNPRVDKEKLIQRTQREVLELNDGKNYGIYVGISEAKVVGFCRFYHTDQVNKEKIKFEFISGIYCMGMIVDESYRRKGIAKQLASFRFEVIKKLGHDSVYSMVANDNQTSKQMHLYLGYEEIKRAKGFLNIHFECGEGVLFKKQL